MALYKYVKAPPARARMSKRKKTIASLSLMTVGGVLLLWVLWPILSFTIISDNVFVRIIAPVEDKIAAGSYETSSVVLAAGIEDEQKEKGADFTNANVWYPTSPQKKIVAPVNTYAISIPKLNITDALVTVAGDDLSTSLVHYGGTALPGQYGNSVVFGHSTLPQFFNPKSYKTIFSTLPTLKEGDKILVSSDGVNYQYVVYEMIVTEPNDVSTLEQRFDDSYLTLVTCVPPGTYWKRLSVRTKLHNPNP